MKNELTLGSLGDNEAEDLIRQTRNGNPTVNVKSEIVRRIRELTNNAPYLIQRLCSKLFNNEEEKSLSAVSFDTLNHVYHEIKKSLENSYNLLSGLQKQIFYCVSYMGPIWDYELPESIDKDSRHDELDRLCELGYLKEESDVGYSMPNYFFKRWLNENPRKQRKWYFYLILIVFLFLVNAVTIYPRFWSGFFSGIASSIVASTIISFKSKLSQIRNSRRFEILIIVIIVVLFLLLATNLASFLFEQLINHKQPTSI